MKKYKKTLVILISVLIIVLLFFISKKTGTIEDLTPIAYWGFEGDTSDFFGGHDLSNNGVTFTDGIVGKSAYFDGNSLLSDESSDFEFDVGEDNFSIAVWLNIGKNITTSTGIMGTLKSLSSSTGFALYLAKENNVKLSLRYGNKTNVGLSSLDYTKRAGEWHHFVVVVDPTTISWYIDGLYVHNTPITFGNPSVVQYMDYSSLKIGQYYQGGTLWNGNMDEIYIFDRALTPSEVDTIYNQHEPQISDTTPPSFNNAQDSVEIGLGDSFSYSFNVTDNVGVASFEVNDTSFSINLSGMLTNSTILDKTEYHLEIKAKDVNGNEASFFFKLKIIEEAGTTQNGISSTATTEEGGDDKTLFIVGVIVISLLIINKRRKKKK